MLRADLAESLILVLLKLRVIREQLAQLLLEAVDLHRLLGVLLIDKLALKRINRHLIFVHGAEAELVSETLVGCPVRRVWLLLTGLDVHLVVDSHDQLAQLFIELASSSRADTNVDKIVDDADESELGQGIHKVCIVVVHAVLVLEREDHLGSEAIFIFLVHLVWWRDDTAVAREVQLVHLHNVTVG